MDRQEQQEQPSFVETVLGLVKGVFDTGIGFGQTTFGFAVIRFFYSIPIWLAWSFILAFKTNLPALTFIEIWAIMVAFDCFRFDITKHYK